MSWGRASVVIVVLVALAPIPVIHGLGTAGLDALFQADRAVRGDAAIAAFRAELTAAIEPSFSVAPLAVWTDGRAPRVGDAASGPAADPRFATVRELLRRGGASAGLDAIERLRDFFAGDDDSRLLASWASVAALATTGRTDLADLARARLNGFDASALSVPGARFLAAVKTEDDSARAAAVDSWLDDLATRDTDLDELSWLAVLADRPEPRQRLSDLARREAIAGELDAVVASLAPDERALAVTRSGAFLVAAPSRAVSRIDLDARLLELCGAAGGDRESTVAPRRFKEGGIVVDLGEREVRVPLAGQAPFSGVDVRAILQGGIALYGALVIVLGYVLERGRSRAEALVAARSDLVAQVTHELRTPLAVLRMYGETLASGRIEESARAEYVATMSAEAARLGLLVDRIARAARDEEPNEEPAEIGDASCDVGQVASALVAAWSRVARERGGEVRATIDPDLRVAIGPEDLRFALDVLLDNAVSYGVDGGGIAKVELEAKRAADRVEVTIRDHGRGIPKPERDRLFERFARGEAGKRLARHGAGMGLFLARRVVSAARGELALEFPDDGGTRARLVLPIARGDELR